MQRVDLTGLFLLLSNFETFLVGLQNLCEEHEKANMWSSQGIDIPDTASAEDEEHETEETGLESCGIKRKSLCISGISRAGVMQKP